MCRAFNRLYQAEFTTAGVSMPVFKRSGKRREFLLERVGWVVYIV